MSTQFSFRLAAGAALACALTLSACAAPDLGPRPQLRTPGDLAASRALADDAVAREWPDERWWTVYGDPQLDSLVAEALANSPDVAAAAARIRQARGAAEVTGAAGLPQISGEASGGFTKQSYNNGVPSDFVPRGWKSTGTLALSGDFDLDLWGRTRSALAAARSETEAREVDARQAVLLLSSNVVSSYFDLARLLERDKSLTEAVKARQDVYDLTDGRVREGLENQGPLRQARAAVASARIELAANREQIALRRHAIAALLGAGPDRALDLVPTPIAAVPAQAVPEDAGIALAGRRPDIVAARLRVEAAGSRIDSAKAAFLPDISLRGLIGLTSLGISNLIDDGSTYGNAGGALSLPIFQGGRLSGQYRQTRGQYDEAVAAYNGTVVSALQEVADSLAGREVAQAQERDAIAARSDADAAYTIAMKRYRGGLSSYIEALSALQSALDARETAIDAHFRLLAREVALKRALGGGFADRNDEKVQG
ncbi:RND transporter [Novosphingobium sp. PC22D]|uniref:efflux transporter outer membrane subunit n=1 Tax=Novosphingobium sp. PC22D TaxID=1962403 RepID=UPI000BEF8DAE|nr:efflux transporter outer membrane subunit [Novosphingobium sp. PC22D]PEQ12799.1 RND transporter [Novosphingobium sp. PC22D]